MYLHLRRINPTIRSILSYPPLSSFFFFFFSFFKDRSWKNVAPVEIIKSRRCFRGTGLRRSTATSTWTRAPRTWPTSAKWGNGIIGTRANCSIARATWSREARESFGRRTERRTRSFCSAAICAGQSRAFCSALISPVCLKLGKIKLSPARRTFVAGRSSLVDLRETRKLDRPVIPFTRDHSPPPTGRGWSRRRFPSILVSNSRFDSLSLFPFQTVDVRVRADESTHGIGGISLRARREDVGKQHETTLSPRAGQVFRADHHHRGLFRCGTLDRDHRSPGTGSGCGEHRQLFLQREMQPRWLDERQLVPTRSSCVRQPALFQQRRAEPQGTDNRTRRAQRGIRFLHNSRTGKVIEVSPSIFPSVHLCVPNLESLTTSHRYLNDWIFYSFRRENEAIG